MELLEARRVLAGVYGWVWNDVDLDAIWDTEETAVAGRTVLLTPTRMTNLT